MSTIKVRLADAPTDVLVHLVDHGPATITDLAAALAPNDADHPASTISYAVDLLRRIGYARCLNATYQWAATPAGAHAVAEARAALEPHQ